MKDEVDVILKALAERHRRQILQILREAEVTAGNIAAQMDVSRPAVSQHLAILENAGRVRARREGTRRL